MIEGNNDSMMAIVETDAPDSLDGPGTHTLFTTSDGFRRVEVPVYLLSWQSTQYLAKGYAARMATSPGIDSM